MYTLSVLNHFMSKTSIIYYYFICHYPLFLEELTFTMYVLYV